MLSAKSFVVLAAAAFAIAQVDAAAQATHIKISIEKHHTQCDVGFREVSVEGVEGVFCAEDKICVADYADGNCPTEAAPGMPYGAYCDKVKTGVYGCKPVTEDMLEDSEESEESEECGEGESPISVEGVEGVFCVAGKACVADIKDGACPGKQDGLPYGAYCDKVKTGVYGCKPSKPSLRVKSHNKTHHKQLAPCKAGYREVSVEGVAGVFCAKDQICVANIMGNCPYDKAPGLPYGAYCGKVKTGVYGCKPIDPFKGGGRRYKSKVHAKDATKCSAGSTEVSVEGVEGIFCAKDKICVADHADGNCPTEAAPGMPYGAYCDKVKTGVYGCKPVTEDMLEESEESEECDEGESPMSVEGVEGVFCVAGKACVADIKDGACPGKQDGLPNGSSCGKVKTGVYGCKPN